MTPSHPPSLAGSDWLVAPAVVRIFSSIGVDGDEVRVVGGAVRNALLGTAVRDLDFATTAPPEIVEARAGAAGFKVVRTGFEHGTVTLVFAGKGYEVTTLREDVETDGRRAVVRFGRDWDADARRRDFTVNSLSVDAAGTVHDPVGGYDDILRRRVRFIGDAAERIAEDRLRILRFFRFHAEYALDELDPAGLSAVIRGRDGLRALSAERVGQEMRKIVLGARAGETLAAMQDCGILPIVFGGVGYLGPFDRLIELEKTLAPPSDAATTKFGVAFRLAAIGCRIEEDALRLAERLRLANAERDRALTALAAARRFSPLPGMRQLRHLLYRQGAESYGDAVSLAFAWTGHAADDPAWRDAFRLPAVWQVPRFPLSGRDIVGAGTARGPAVGALLESLEAWWVERDFAPDEAALRSRLQQMIAGEQ